jgi:YVTN family beta-propeller protein
MKSRMLHELLSRLHGKMIILLIIVLPFNLFAQTPGMTKSGAILLPNGWKLSPAGETLFLGDLPLNIAVSHSEKLLAVTNNGESDQYVQLFDLKTKILLDSVQMGKSWLGLAFSDNDNYLYVSGGNDNWIVKFAISTGRLIPADTFRLGKPWPERISVAGIAIDDQIQVLYTVTRENNSLYAVDLKSKRITQKLPLGAEGYTCILSPNRKMLYISCWGCEKIKVYDTSRKQMTDSFQVGSHPNDLCLTKNGRYLFVANANDNSVSVIDLQLHKVIEVLNTALYPDAPSGSTTNSVALSKDEHTLYIANADNNCLAVFDINLPGNSKSKGFIPTGWYPTCVRVAKNKILVANGKGNTSLANPFGPDPTRIGNEVIYQKAGKKVSQKEQYIGGLFRGTLNIINPGSEKELAAWSVRVYENTPYTKKKEKESEGEANNPIPFKLGDPSPIKHIFYIIKENRTYDQVLGDIAEGNGDTSLVLFGKKITPNQHALAKEFVLLDNFYVDGEVSADGHNWTDGAYATDYLEKHWPTNYGGRGGDYDAEGTRAIANNKNGFIWDFCKRKGVSFRTYGEFADNYKPNIPVLQGHYCPYFTSWDQKVRDTTRFCQWKKEFDSLLIKGSVPSMNTLRFINDHTEGLVRGRPTPFVHVADNDLAVGLFVDYLSHSPIWKESVVFILEDDAQNGPDHVDAHRSPAYIAGGLVKQGFVDHTMYSTSSMLRTLELILGIPPMSQYDAAATPMWRCFSQNSIHQPYTMRPCLVDLTQINMADNKWSRQSETFDFTAEDRVPDALFNEVIWVAVKGENSICPAPRHAAFFKQVKEKDDD